MKSVVKRLLKLFGGPVDLIMGIVALPSALVLLAYRKAGSGRLPLTTNLLMKIGVFPIRNHYYEPLFVFRNLTKPLSEDRFLPGIDLNIDGQLRFLDRLNYSQELLDLDLSRQSRHVSRFSIDNPSFGSGDAEYLYQFLRSVKPRKVIEVGSGHSTKIANEALQKNRAEGTESEHICLSPTSIHGWNNSPEFKLCASDWKSADSIGPPPCPPGIYCSLIPLT